MRKNWMQPNQEDEASLQKLWELSGNYKSNYEPNVAKGLATLKSRIAEDATTPATKVVSLNRTNWLRRIAAAIILLVTFGFLAQQFLADAPTTQQLVTTDTVLKDIQLPDGSTVWVNKNSQLTFPSTFGSSERIVKLTGEAFFKVERDTEKPFIVQMDNSQVRVLGTAFNVRSYEAESAVVVEVEEGKVQFSTDESTETSILTANEKVVFNKEQVTLEAQPSTDWTDTAWKKSQLNFEDQSLSEVFNYLRKNFNVEVNFGAEQVKGCGLNATLVNNTPEAILKQVKAAFPSIELKRMDATTYQFVGSCD
ncbi:MAG: FecR domain-containing protein [Bacteroidota bacterium]